MSALVYEGLEVARLTGDADAAQLVYDPRWLETPAAFPVSLEFPLEGVRFRGGAVAAWAADAFAAPPEERFGALRREGQPPPAAGAATTSSAAGRPARLGPDGPEPALDDAPSTHRLTLEPPERPGWSEMSALCLALAARVGLPASTPAPWRDGDGRRGLLVTRADRAIGRGGRVARLHGEDVACALGRPRAGLADLFDLADRHLSADERLTLLDAVIFFSLLGDVDADARRYRVILSGGPRLAPFEAAAMEGPWPAARRKLALRFPTGARRGDQLADADWRAAAAACRLNQTFILRRVEAMRAAMLAEAEPAAAALGADPGWRAPALGHFARRLRASLDPGIREAEGRAADPRRA